jgi:pilus assembly protein CpaE
LTALDSADRIILVTQLNVPALRSTQRTLALFQRLGYEADKVSVVVNRHQASDAVSLSDASEVLGREIFFKIPNDYRTLSGALSKGVPVTDFDASSHLSWSFDGLAGRMNGGTSTKGTPAQSVSRLGRLFRRGRK